MFLMKPQEENRPHTHTPPTGSTRLSDIVKRKAPAIHPSHPTDTHTTGQKRLHGTQRVLRDPLGDTSDNTGPHSGERRQQLSVFRGIEWSCRKTTHFLCSPDRLCFHRMPFPSAGPCMTQNFNYFYSGQRKTRNFNNRSAEIIPAWPSAIVKDARGNYSTALLGVPQ